MIALVEYFGKWMHHPDATEKRIKDAEVFLTKVNNLIRYYGQSIPLNEKTGTEISGVEYGGFRPMSCPQGAPGSSHKQGRGVDIYDPMEELDDFLTDPILRQFDLYREHPEKTAGWCHLTDRAPPSGRRTFWP